MNLVHQNVEMLYIRLYLFTSSRFAASVRRNSHIVVLEISQEQKQLCAKGFEMGEKSVQTDRQAGTHCLVYNSRD